MHQVFALATLVVMGVIVADLVTHPAGVQAGGGALVGIAKPAFSALLGQAPK